MHINEFDFERDSNIYLQSVKAFFNAEKDILDTLFKFENDNSLCNWIVPDNPFSSHFDPDEIKKCYSARMLIINYLTKDNKEITEKKVYSWNEIKKWIKVRKGLTKSELQDEFQKNPPG
jgi:hypothetical protein